MTHHHPITTAESSAGLYSTGMAARIAKAWHAYWRRRAQLTTIHLLHTLDDRTLHDIGVSRSEITSLVYGRHGERKRCYEEAWRSWRVGL